MRDDASKPKEEPELRKDPSKPKAEAKQRKDASKPKEETKPKDELRRSKARAALQRDKSPDGDSFAKASEALKNEIQSQIEGIYIYMPASTNVTLYNCI